MRLIPKHNVLWFALDSGDNYFIDDIVKDQIQKIEMVP